MKNARLQFIITIILFGTIGTLSRYINMPSSIICMGRAIAGALIILLILAVRKQPLDKEAVRRNIGWLTLSSACLCVNWICQFEAYKHTTIATATLCYYMQPVFFILLAATVLKEHISGKKLVCVFIAFIGMIFVSGVLETGLHISELKGVLFGIAGGFFYAVVVLINKYMKNISTVETTVIQLSMVTLIMLPYSAATGAFGEVHVTTIGLVCLLVLGCLHTGIAYIAYFDSVNKLPAQTVGILSCIDPVEALLLSAFSLREPITLHTILGAVLILGATAVSEFNRK